MHMLMPDISRNGRYRMRIDPRNLGNLLFFTPHQFLRVKLTKVTQYAPIGVCRVVAGTKTCVGDHEMAELVHEGEAGKRIIG
jgi:hypothetical protein